MSDERKIRSRPRPLSPHLQVYKPQITSMLSIMHRGCGVVLYISAFVFAAYLYTYAFWQEFNVIEWLSSNPVGNYIGLPIALGLTFVLCFHFCNGIRHLFWDAGKGYDIEVVYHTGRTVLGCSITLTLCCWSAVTYPVALQYFLALTFLILIRGAIYKIISGFVNGIKNLFNKK